MSKFTNVPLNKLFNEDQLPNLPPWIVLGSHVTQKFAQAGTVGFIIASPLVWAYWKYVKKSIGPFGWTSYIAKYYPRTLGVAAGIGLLQSAYHLIIRLDKDGIEDRAYRLSYNLPNVRVDNRALISASAGVVLYTALADKNTTLMRRILKGAALGYGAGVALSLMIELIFKARKQAMSL